MKNLTLIRLIQFRAGYNLPVHAGIETGIFARNGLKLAVTYTPSSTFLADGLMAGDFDIGHMAADDVVAEVEGRTLGMPGGADLFLFMGLHSGLLGLVGAPKFKDVKSLRGKTLAVDAKTTGFVFILERILRSAGIPPDEYELVQVGGWESRFHSLLKGEHAATLLTEPFLGDALEAGCHLLAQGHDAVPVYQATCGSARRSWAQENEDTLIRYIRAYVESTGWCFDPKNRRTCLDLLAAKGGLEGPAAERTVNALLDPTHGLYPTAKLNIGGIATALELRAEMGHLATPVPSPGKYVDLSYYQKAVGSGSA